MSIHYSKARKKYFICYKYQGKTFSIYNPLWTSEVGKKYMKSIEQETIKEDIKRRSFIFNRKQIYNLTQLADSFIQNNYVLLKKQTAYGKEIIVNKYILKTFPTTLPLEETFKITTMDNFRNKIVSLEFSQKRTNDIFRVTKELLIFASERDFISYDYARKMISLIKPIRAQKEVKEKLFFWTPEQFNQFINTFADNDKFKMLFKVAYQCALRIGELLALNWSDFNFESKTLSISKSVDNSGLITSTKNMSSNATVSISSKLAEELSQFKNDFGAKEGDPIFFATKRTSRTTIRRIMDEHIKIANLPHIKFHGLRHSCASMLINNGVSPLIVSKHLRHSSVKETLDTYSHIFPNETKGLADKLFK